MRLEIGLARPSSLRRLSQSPDALGCKNKQGMVQAVHESGTQRLGRWMESHRANHGGPEPPTIPHPGLGGVNCHFAPPPPLFPLVAQMRHPSTFSKSECLGGTLGSAIPNLTHRHPLRATFGWDFAVRYENVFWAERGLFFCKNIFCHFSRGVWPPAAHSPSSPPLKRTPQDTQGDPFASCPHPRTGFLHLDLRMLPCQGGLLCSPRRI
jgi:hypothetical protein